MRRFPFEVRLQLSAAGLPNQPADDFLAPRRHHLSGAHQHLGARDRRQGRPGGLGFGGTLIGRVEIVAIALKNFEKGLSGIGIAVNQLVTGIAAAPLARDRQQVEPLIVGWRLRFPSG